MAKQHSPQSAPRLSMRARRAIWVWSFLAIPVLFFTV